MAKWSRASHGGSRGSGRAAHERGTRGRKASSKAKLGSGGRSAALRRKGLSGALIGYLGRRKYGAKRMAKWSAQGRRRASRRR